MMNITVESMADDFKFEYMENCNCGRPQKAVFFCSDKDCPYNLTQPYYCPDCGDKLENKHNHPPSKIRRQVQVKEKDWLNL